MCSYPFLVYLKPVFSLPPSSLCSLIFLNRNCVAADVEIGSENCVIADPEIGSQNYVAADAEIGSQNYIVADHEIGSPKLRRCRSGHR